MNFRPDRGRQLSEAFVIKELPSQVRGAFARGPRIENLLYLTLTEYEQGLDAQVAYRADEIKMPLAGVVSACGLRQFHYASNSPCIFAE